MHRKILAITGTRSDYGLMSPVFQAIRDSDDLELELIVSGMHLLPEFASGLARIREDNFGILHHTSMLLGEDSGKAMSQSLGLAIFNFSELMGACQPDILLLQGDRGEMLAGAIAAAHMNIPIVHMSGGDYSGSIDDSIRNAISKFSHIHLTTCRQSSERLYDMGETKERVIEVGESGLDVIRSMKYVPAEDIAKELQLDLSRPIILATQHPVTTETDEAVPQLMQTLEALEELGMQTVFTYPNSDAGGREMAQALETHRNRDYMRIVANLGSQKFLSLMRIASVMVGNSSSGILESASFALPVINIGTRQHGRLQANNVIDVDHDHTKIKDAILFAMNNAQFRDGLGVCKNPYGDGHTAARTVDLLQRLKITPGLLAKWMPTEKTFFQEI